LLIANVEADALMKALTRHGKKDIRCETVPDPRIEHGHAS